MLVSETLLGCLGDPAFEVEFDVTASIATGTSELVDFDGDEQPAAVTSSTPASRQEVCESASAECSRKTQGRGGVLRRDAVGLASDVAPLVTDAHDSEPVAEDSC